MSVVSCLLLLLLTAGCLLYASVVQTALAEAVFLCLNVIFPSLYAIMILSQLLLQTNAHSILLLPVRRLARTILRLPDTYLAIFLISQFAGYPVGAKLLDNPLQEGTLSRTQASVLTGICFGSGPAFLFGTLSAMAGHSACQLLFGSLLLSNLLLLLLVSRWLHLEQHTQTLPLRKLSSLTLVETVSQSGASLLKMCAMILFFRCLLAILDASGIVALLSIPLDTLFPENTAQGLLGAFLEITSLTQLSPNTPLMLALFAALLSFGGICVHLQIFTVTGGRLSLLIVLGMRTISAILSGTFCFLGCQLFPQILLQQTAAVAANAPPFQFNSTTPAASLLLVGTTLLLLCTASKQERLLSTRK